MSNHSSVMYDCSHHGKTEFCSWLLEIAARVFSGRGALALLLVGIQMWSSYLTASLCTALRKSGIIPSGFLASPHCDQWLRTRKVDATCRLLVLPLLWLLPHVFPGLVPYLILKEHRIWGVGVLESLDNKSRM